MKKVLILGESGTGKTTSIRNFSPDEVKIISVVKGELPFRGDYEVVLAPTGKDIIKELKNTNKKVIIIDDFQYVLGIPMMTRIGEKGWDKFNEIQQPYADVLNTLNELEKDTVVYLMSHTETTQEGKTRIKTIGNALDRYMTVEGLFTVVLGTKVIDDKYYFVTQNSGNDTLKSPIDMFPSKFINNDLKYVDDKIRNYYAMTGAKTDEEIKKDDNTNRVVTETVEKPKRSRGRTKKAIEEAINETLDTVDKIAEESNTDVVDYDEIAQTSAEATPIEEVAPRRARTRRVRN